MTDHAPHYNSMKPFGIILATLLIGASWVHSAIPSGWATNLPAALQAASARQAPVLAYYTADWCGPCQRLARTTLTNAAVQAALASFYRVAIDVDTLPKESRPPAAQAIPTFVVLAPSGEELMRLTGYQDAESFVPWLTNGLAVAQRAIAARQKSEQRLARAQFLLSEPESELTREAVTDLFDLCALRDGTLRQSSVEVLGVLANQRPSLVLDGLNHPQLATRIAVANLLRARLGDAFDIDPWAPATNRQQAVATWKTRLAASDSNPPRR